MSVVLTIEVSISLGLINLVINEVSTINKLKRATIHAKDPIINNSILVDFFI